MDDAYRKIGVLVKTSFVDFPGTIATALFLRGCNLKCPYCYNRDLVIGEPDPEEMVSFDQVINHLEKRKKVIAGFVISGGEPTISPYTENLIVEARKLGYKIKLDTNGLSPEKLAYFLDNKDLRPDFVAMDVKTSPSKYHLLKPQDGHDSEKALTASIELVSALPKSCREFRTVLVPVLVTDSDIREIATLLPKDATWKLGKFRTGECIDPNYNKIQPYNDLQYKELTTIASGLIPNTETR